MKPEEAIQAVKEVTGMSLPWNDRHYEALQMALSALEKQIPMRPKMPLDAYWTCPTCGKRVMDPDEHCIGCGQKIYWTDGEG